MNATTHHGLTDCQAYEQRQTFRSADPAGWISRVFGLWRVRIRQRQAFAKLDSRDLRDIGVSRWEVDRELAKPFWRD
jgi:uncharacterized protein YjiS (DUF1127 family)